MCRCRLMQSITRHYNQHQWGQKMTTFTGKQTCCRTEDQAGGPRLPPLLQAPDLLQSLQSRLKVCFMFKDIYVPWWWLADIAKFVAICLNKDRHFYMTLDKQVFKHVFKIFCSLLNAFENREKEMNYYTPRSSNIKHQMNVNSSAIVYASTRPTEVGLGWNNDGRTPWNSGCRCHGFESWNHLPLSGHC